MYTRGAGFQSIITSGTVAGSGAVILPNTGGNTLGTVLAYTAITLGLIAVVSQIIVRIARRHYQ